MITRDQLLERREVLVKDLATNREQLAQAQTAIQHHGSMIQALSGALQNCDYFLSRLDAPCPVDIKTNGLDTTYALKMEA